MQLDIFETESQIICDLDKVSVEDKQKNRTQHLLQFLDHCRSEVTSMYESSESQENTRNKLEKIVAAFRNSQQNHGKMISDINTMKNDHFKQIKEKQELLNSKMQTLEEVIEDLKKDESSLSLDYKQEKLSYKKALNFYRIHTGFNIDIKEKSDHLVKGDIKFASVKYEKPICVTVDKVNKKVIDFQCSELPTEDANGETRVCLANLPSLMTCTLREHLVNSDKK